MLIIQASNIHQGGGQILLIYVIQELIKKQKQQPLAQKRSVLIFVDARFGMTDYFSSEDLQLLQIEYIKATVIERLLVEYKIWKAVQKNGPSTKVLCFGNLPPLLPLQAHVMVYFHTVLYFKEFAYLKLNFKLQIKLAIEKIWIRLGMPNVKSVYVQTEFVRKFFITNFKFSEVKLFPFFPEDFLIDKSFDSNKLSQTKSYDFIYPAAGVNYKNHLNLIEAWNLLAQENIFPSLILTVDSSSADICDSVNQSIQKFQTRIQNIGMQNHARILSLYKESKALIFPSYCESFGLPLLEARVNDLPIVAAEADYVREQVDPSETFDPSSALSIARAVKRFLKIPDKKNKMGSVHEFVYEISL